MIRRLRRVIDTPSRAVRAAITLIVVFFAIFAVIMAVWLTQSYQDARHRAADRASAASEVVATNARWINELARQALRRIDESLGPSVGDGTTAAVRDIRDAVDSLPGQVKAYIVDQTGDTLFSTDPQVKPINITDREYFSALEAGAQSYVSPLMVSRLNGKQIFVFSRRLERNGAFAGAAIVSFDVDLLKEIWSSLKFSGDSTVSLIREDGQLVARYPLADGPLDMSSYVLFTDYLKKSPAGFYFAESPLDHTQRLVGYRKVDETPFIAIAAVDFSEAMQDYWHNTIVTMLLALPAVVGLLLASIWITSLLSRDAARRIQLAQALDTNQLLLREIHHRVKNNLQSVQSLVRIQNIPDAAKADLRSRIAAMSAVHEHIYRFDEYVQIRADELLTAVVSTLVETFGGDVEVEFDLDAIKVEHDHATPLALLANEVVTNSLKYAFGAGKPGRIHVRLKDKGDGRAELVIGDDGRGFDAGAVREGMGSRLIKGVVNQMNGTYRYEHDGGSVFVADISLRTPKVGDRPAAFYMRA